MSEKLIFPIGFDLEEGVKQAGREWKNHYRKRLQDAIDSRPLKVKIDFESKGIDTKEFKQWMALSREAEKLERERIKNAKEWQKVADQAAMAETRRANATNESNARIERANRKAEASERRKKDAVERTNAAYKTQSNYLSRLVQRMVAYASVAQAFSFIRNIREVTAEFELQRVALGSIIGDMNEANKMFEQIKAAAVKSPFQIKELVTYTKQLAAYKIESDELFETTQRLADVSAGLGVGMERLVLAYGQIRATGYLRASEVRQLTEAGIPIVEELAKKMSQLRGETVSAAEVMGLISERAISFGMVKEVFDDMTSAGGMFYKMQEKQAETLAGQWSNLKDSIAIMYEEIGNTESVNNSIKGMIGLVKWLAENWRTLYYVVGWTSTAFLGMRGLSKLLPDISNYAIRSAAATRKYNRAMQEMRIAIQNGDKALIRSARSNLRYQIMMRNAEKATSGFMRSLKKLWAVMVANPWTTIITALALIGSALYAAYENATRLNKELARIGVEGEAQSRQQAQNFDRLARVIRNSVDGSKEQSDALKELKRSYGDLLPEQDVEIRDLLRTEEGYNNVANAIRQKIALQIQEQKINAITSDRAKVIGEAQSEVRPYLEKAGYSPESINKIFEEISRAINDGRITITRDIKANADAINRVLGNVGIELDLVRLVQPVIGNDYWTAFNRTAELILEYAKAEAELKSRTDEVVKSMENQTLQLGEYSEKYKEFKEGYGKISTDKEPFTFEADEDLLNQRIEYYKTFVQQLLAEAKSLGEDEGGISEETYNQLLGLDNLDEVMEELGNRVPTMSGILQELRRGFTNLAPTQEMDVVKRSIMSISSATGVSMDLARRFLMKNGETTEQWRKRIHEEYEDAKKDVVSLRILLGQAIAMGAETSEIEDALQKAEDIEKVTAEIAKAYAIMNNSGRGGGGGGHQKDAWVATMEERMKYMKDFQQGVEKLSKTMSRASAIEREQMIMLNRGVALGLNPKELKGSTEELLAWYEKSIQDTVAKIQKFKGFKGLTVEQILSTKTKNKTIQEYQALLQSLYNSMTDFETSQVAKDMEKKLKKLSDDISRTKTAKEFFDRMLGLTGDRELAATLTMSVYGIEKPEGELSEFFAKQLAKDMQSQIQKYLPNIDISSAINKATGEIDPVKLKGIVDALDPLKAEQTNIDAVKKLIDEMISGNAKYIESLYNSYEKFLDYEHRKTIVAEREAKERKKIAEQNIPEDEKKKLTEASEKREREETYKIDLEEFKASEDWIMTFENIDRVGTKSIKHLMSLIEQFVAAHADSPEKVKAIMTEYNKLYEGIIARNPLQAITDGVKEYFDALKEVRKAKRDEDYQKAIKDEETAKAEVRQARRDVRQASNDEEKTVATAKLTKAEEKLAKAQKKRAQSEGSIRKAQNKQVAALSKVHKGVNEAINAYNALGEIASTIQDTFNVDEASDFGVALKSVGQALAMVAGVLGVINAIITLIETHPLVLAISAAIMAIIGGIMLFNNLKTRDAEKEIERLNGIIEGLEYSYERLEKAQEKAFGTDYISNYEQRLANLQAQQDAYLKQADAERSKGKKADEDKIKEYENAARDTADEIKDMQAELSEYFLGTDLTSAARDFANAWIDAYKEFANTTDAMKEKFQDMIQNMIVESLIAKVMERALKPVFDMVDDMGDSDFYSNSFWSQLMTEMNKATENGVVGAQNIMGMLESIGINLRDTGTGLTGISRDIASASEESILSLAAGINTQNFYISQVPTKLDTIIGLLRGGSAVVDSGVNVQDLITIQNQFLSSLPTIAQNTAETVARCERAAVACESMASKLGSVIKPKGTTSTHSVNVTIGS